MRQARIGRRGDERDHLMLQIDAHRERNHRSTQCRSADCEAGWAQKVANSPELKELSQHTSIDDVAQTIAEEYAWR